MSMAEQVFSKEAKSYGQNINNFIAEDEITVTITLGEYRDLIVKDARHKHEIDKQDKRYWELKHEKDELQAKLDSVLTKLADCTVEADDEE